MNKYVIIVFGPAGQAVFEDTGDMQKKSDELAALMKEPNNVMSFKDQDAYHHYRVGAIAQVSVISEAQFASLQRRQQLMMAQPGPQGRRS